VKSAVSNLKELGTVRKLKASFPERLGHQKVELSLIDVPLPISLILKSVEPSDSTTIIKTDISYMAKSSPTGASKTLDALN
jgi:hypothetical protein